MANDDSTRPGFDLSPWKVPDDPMSLFQAAWLWAGIPPTLPIATANERYPEALAAARGWLDRLVLEANKPGGLPVQKASKRVQTSRGVSGSAYLDRPGRPPEYREIDDWPAALVALADLRSYAESIGERPAFLFPDAPAPKTSAAALGGGQGAAPSDTKEPPQKWRNGLKRIAYEEAVKLVQEHGDVRGPALWAAMKAHKDVKDAGRDSDQIELRVCVSKLTRGEARVSKTQVQNAWRKSLDELLK